MGLSITKGTVGTQQINVTGGLTTALPIVGTGQTLVNVSAAGQSTGAAFYTVTAGKTFYCLGFSFSLSAAGRGGLTWSATNHCESSCPANGSSSQTGGILFSLPATTAITTYTTAGANTWTGCMWGYEA